MTESEHIVLLYAFGAFGPVRLSLLLKYFGSAKNVWNAKHSELVKVGLSRETVDKFEKHRLRFDKTYFVRLKRLEIKYTVHGEENYPRNLFKLKDAPLVLYYLGELNKKDDDAVAIVGTRKITSYGRDVANTFAYELSSFGITIVSGLALGIDTVSHRSALQAGGRTLAVIACGLDGIYPASNIFLAREILKRKKGVIFSEFPLGFPARRENFATRNRIISGLSKAVVVVEGLEKSGTLLTAKAAAEQGREVFAVPGSIFSPMSAAPQYLIKNGAKFAFSAKDLLDELNLQTNVDKEEFQRILPEDEMERKILKIIKREPKHIDEIVRQMKEELGKVLAKLSFMEIKGLVREGDGVYGIKK